MGVCDMEEINTEKKCCNIVLFLITTICVCLMNKIYFISFHFSFFFLLSVIYIYIYMHLNCYYAYYYRIAGTVTAMSTYDQILSMEYSSSNFQISFHYRMIIIRII